VTNGLVTHNTGRGSATAPAFQCVTGETEILTPHGVRTAAQLIDPVIPDDAYNPFKAHEVTVWGGEGWETTTNVFKSWRSDLLRIRTKCGNQITCTPEHPIWLHIFQGSQSLQWVQAKDIGEADRIALPKPVTRAAPPEGYPDEAFEALGVIAAHGYLAATGDTLYIETKPEHSDTIMQAAAKLGITASRERAVDGASVRDVVRVQMVPDMPPRAVQWLLWIPHPSVPINSEFHKDSGNSDGHWRHYTGREDALEDGAATVHDAHQAWRWINIQYAREFNSEETKAMIHTQLIDTSCMAQRPPRASHTVPHPEQPTLDLLSDRHQP
jgi:hypothetical protein